MMLEINQVYCMDALDLLRQLDDGSVDAIITDPPYGLTELAFDQTPIDWSAFWQESRRVLASPHSPVVLFSQQPFTTDLINSNRAWFRFEIIYEKTMPVGYLSANQRPLRCHENIEVFAAKGADYFPVMEQTTAYRVIVNDGQGRQASHYGAHRRKGYTDTGKRFPRSVWRFSQRHTAFANKETLHPTEKPLLLMERLVLTFSEAGALIVDPFAGSGSTGFAAIKNGRRFIGGDISPEYAAAANTRLAQPYTVRMFE